MGRFMESPVSKYRGPVYYLSPARTSCYSVQSWPAEFLSVVVLLMILFVFYNILWHHLNSWGLIYLDCGFFAFLFGCNFIDMSALATVRKITLICFCQGCKGYLKFL